MTFLDDFNPKVRKQYFLNLEVGTRIRLIGKEGHRHYHGIRINGEILQVHKPVQLKDPVQYLVLLENGDIVSARPESIIKVLNHESNGNNIGRIYHAGPQDARSTEVLPDAQ